MDLLSLVVGASLLLIGVLSGLVICKILRGGGGSGEEPGKK